ncbi:MAG TPA: ABC transporter substrate-binding protein [Brevibacterium sp.]|nr:ABC transporter substrate-binding protein [Brevibacterium sp.]
MITSSQRTSAMPAAAAFVSVTLLLAGCSGSGTAATEDSAGGDEQPGVSLVPEAEGTVEYPLTLDTVHGTIEIAERPERVAVMGHSANHDAVAALGVTPVYAAADRDIDFGWTDPAWLDGIDTLDVQDGNAVNVEGVAAAEPDLIFLPNTAEMFEEEDLARLAAIAPVLEAPDVISGDQVDWRDAPQLLGEALDLRSRAEDAIREADEAIEATSEEHPEFDGRTITLAYDYGEEFGIDYYTVTDGTAEEIVTLLGFEPNPLAEQFVADAAVSEENQAQLDADVLVMFYSDDATREAREASELFQQVPAVADDRYVAVVGEEDERAEDGAIWALRRGTSVLSIPWTLDALADWAGEVDVED